MQSSDWQKMLPTGDWQDGSVGCQRQKIKVGWKYFCHGQIIKGSAAEFPRCAQRWVTDGNSLTELTENAFYWWLARRISRVEIWASQASVVQKNGQHMKGWTSHSRDFRMLHCRKYQRINALNLLLDKITSYRRHYPSSFPIMARWQGFPSCVIISAWGNSAEQSSTLGNASITVSLSHPDSSAWRQQEPRPNIRMYLNPICVGLSQLVPHTVGN